MKYLKLLLLIFPVFSVAAQTTNDDLEVYPGFPQCESSTYNQQPGCFEEQLKNYIVENFNMPARVSDENYAGRMVLLFEVTKEGQFKVLYINAVYPELKEEIVRVFSELPRVKPASYNNKPSNIQFRMSVKIPLLFEEKNDLVITKDIKETSVKEATSNQDILQEYDRIQSKEFETPRYSSQLNIPLSHEFYSRFDGEINQVGTNSHSASKPFLFEEVSSYYSFEAENAEMYKNKNSWLGRKIWNEHLVQFQGEDYWFTLDIGMDLQLGKDFESGYDFTYNNTRAVIFQGGLGKNLNFYTVAYENQGRFASYYNRYAESIKPDGGDPAIIPGRGIAKPFMDGGYDYPVAEGYLSYSPSKFFNVQFGHGKNFIGDGYRSLLLSDNASPYPFFKLNTTFWKLKYTNTWMSLRDVRPEVTANDSFRTKFMANHFLSYNVTKRLNLGFFESVMWQDDNQRGFDLNYLNPVIFYRAIEFSTGGRGGNAIIGLSAKYKLSDQFNAYGQFIIDEFSFSDVFGGEKSWKNKQGFQLGLKYFDAFNIPDLFLQTEYNHVRPYTYSHNTVVLNYGHNNQSMAHLWGANFREIIGIARYKKDRLYGSVKIILGERGFDFGDSKNNAYYGGNIYRSEIDRAYEKGVETGQGNNTFSFFSEIEAGYVINPATNLKLFGSFIYRNFKPDVRTPQHFENSTAWLNIGLRTDVFNWYYDY